ncbi:unnamed protein product [Brassicogethes aeneus]|uniref:Homeobox domain-containing protein n=1 Tax=Brassicogethes aeneus TaxID=1431903 RepID=A0A9P0FL18_BRAAE|nr:unnamed protein product [Brassicogethes aeneus]
METKYHEIVLSAAMIENKPIDIALIQPYPNMAPSHVFDGSPKNRRVRTSYSASQLSTLEKEFYLNSYLSRPRKIDISQRLGLNERQVKVWFQNRRMKQKKDNAKATACSNSRYSSGHSSPVSSDAGTPRHDSSSEEDKHIVNNLLNYAPAAIKQNIRPVPSHDPYRNNYELPNLPAYNPFEGFYNQYQPYVTHNQVSTVQVNEAPKQSTSNESLNMKYPSVPEQIAKWMILPTILEDR